MGALRHRVLIHGRGLGSGTTSKIQQEKYTGTRGAKLVVSLRNHVDRKTRSAQRLSCRPPAQHRRRDPRPTMSSETNKSSQQRIPQKTILNTYSSLSIRDARDLARRRRRLLRSNGASGGDRVTFKAKLPLCQKIFTPPHLWWGV